MQKAFDDIVADMLQNVFGACPSGFMEDGPRGTVLLAVSGGIDSMCMAELFMHSSVRIPFAIAHCNFHLRGEESDSDEALVTSWAEVNGIRLHKADFDTAGYAEEKNISIEMAARELRYSWFAWLCRSHGYKALSVAHNANDNVETLFLNLLRGTGIKGLSGMGKVSPFPYFIPGGSDGGDVVKPVVIRPLLDFTRKQIEGYVFAHKIGYHDDRTNVETEYRRNKLRNIVFPLFEQINPSFIRTVGRDMVYFSQVAGIADAYFTEHSSGIMSDGKIDIGKLMSCSHPEYVLYRMLEPFGFNSAVVSSLSSLLKSGRTIGGKVFYSDTHELVTSAASLAVRDRKMSDAEPVMPSVHGRSVPGMSANLSASEPVMAVHGPGNYHFNGVSFSVKAMKWSDGMDRKMPQGSIMFDRKAMDFPFLCRKWTDGDWMRPLGMKGKKKISDLFTDMKYNLFEKESSVMLIDCAGCRASADAASGHVSAVLGARIDDALKVADNTDEVIIITLI